MVITEGFDIPRACMLYQVRDSKSSQLDLQVIGRVRRNPALGYFDRLDSKTQELFSRAFVYGVKPKESGKKRVRLKGVEWAYNEGSLTGLRESRNEILKEFYPFQVTIYKEEGLDEIEIESCIDSSRELSCSVFKAFREIEKSGEKVQEKYGEYVRGFEDFYRFSANLDSIKTKVQEIANKDEFVEVRNVELREDVYSFYNESGFRFSADSWMWESEDDEICLDSEAEKEWARILKKLAKECAKSIEINGDRIYLFGKNFIEKSNVKYEYYDTRKRVSYPDFIFKDKCNRVHIFEVKSVNKSKGQMIESNDYKEKIERLKVAYIRASKKIGDEIEKQRKKGELRTQGYGEKSIESRTESSEAGRGDSRAFSGDSSGDRDSSSGQDFIKQDTIKQDSRVRGYGIESSMESMVDSRDTSEVASVDSKASVGAVSEDFRTYSGDSIGGKITGYIFYIPIKKGDDWDIWCCENGRVQSSNTMNEKIFTDQFKKMIRDRG